MSGETANQISALMSRVEDGDHAAKDALFAALYEELHRLAQAQLRRNGGHLTLGPTTLLHEAYIDIAERSSLGFPDRNRFLGYAARAMRGLIIDYVRYRRTDKRGGELIFTTLADGNVSAAGLPTDVEALGPALGELTLLDPPLAELVDLKFFCGFSFEEIAQMRGVSERTVQRDWVKARVLLHDLLTDGRSNGAS